MCSCLHVYCWCTGAGRLVLFLWLATPQAVNEALEGTGAPVQVVSGYLGRVTISVPWGALMSDSCRVEVTGLMLSVMPCLSSAAGEDLGKHKRL